MFRCKECQAEYEVKPDYCDCGNDTFDEIIPEVKKEEPKKIEEKKVQQAAPPPPPAPVYSRRKTQSFFDPASTIIFAICIILSFIIIFFVGNPKDDIKTVKKEENVKTTANIPNINTFWNNALPKVEVPQPQPIAQAPEPTVQPQPIQQPVQYQPVYQPTYQPQPQPRPQQQTYYQPKTNIQKQQVKQPVSVTTPKVSQPTPTRQAAPTVQKPQSTQQPAVQKTQPAKTTTNTATVQRVNKQELENYKTSLRNKIARNINFANVIGDGTCTVSFSISNSGALLNRKFTKQSDNFTLNDVVYKGVMNVSSYNPPPTGYKNETMKLTVKMYNGNFEVSLY